MAKRPAVTTQSVHVFTAAHRVAMVNAMLELAFRGSKEEALVMRIAKAGGITEVTKHITRMRIYGKKMGLVRASRPAGTAAPARGASKKRSSSRRRAAAGDNTAETGTGSEE